MLITVAIFLLCVHIIGFAFVCRGNHLSFARNSRLHLLGTGKEVSTRSTNVRMRELNESSVVAKVTHSNFIIPTAIATVLLTALGISQYVDVGSALSELVLKIQDLGPSGYIYFSLAYVLAEIFAVPALPLTASSGYLFGLLPGTLLVLFSATLAASISFYIGRTFLRGWAEGYIAGNPKWKAIDKAIGKEGFRVVLLLRLSPLLPFALSNYLYAITSVDFISFIAATVLGFAPGTFAVVYFGTAGKALLADGGAAAANVPWYGYAGAGMLLILAAQTIGHVATRILTSIEEDGH